MDTANQPTPSPARGGPNFWDSDLGHPHQIKGIRFVLAEDSEDCRLPFAMIFTAVAVPVHLSVGSGSFKKMVGLLHCVGRSC